MRCDRCGRQHLLDDEIMTLYLDPELTERVLMAQGEPWPRCRGCNAVDWDLEPAYEPSTEWQWAVVKHR